MNLLSFGWIRCYAVHLERLPLARNKFALLFGWKFTFILTQSFCGIQFFSFAAYRKLMPLYIRTSTHTFASSHFVQVTVVAIVCVRAPAFVQTIFPIIFFFIFGLPSFVYIFLMLAGVAIFTIIVITISKSHARRHTHTCTEHWTCR